MPTNAAEYISQLGVGADTECTTTRDAIAAAIRQWNADHGRAVNFSLMVLQSPEHAENELVDTARLHQLTGAAYPVVWLNLTYDPARLTAYQVAAWEQKYRLRTLAKSSMSLDILGLGSGPKDTTGG